MVCLIADERGEERTPTRVSGRVGARSKNSSLAQQVLHILFIRDFPDDSQTNANIRAFPALLQD
jgi:hypothetical protein